MKRYQVQYQGSRLKALMDTDNFSEALACMRAQAPNGWIIDTTQTPEQWIED